MARNEWTRFGRGSCEGYGLEIGGSNVRFSASVSRGVVDSLTGRCPWWSSINGHDRKEHPTREEAMARVEKELAMDAERFLRDYAGYKMQRERNRFSVAAGQLAPSGADIPKKGTP